MSSSKRFEDLKDELSSVEERIRVQGRHQLNEWTLNRMCSEGDAIVELMRREVESTPTVVQKEMHCNWSEVSKSWNAFKGDVRNRCASDETLTTDDNLRRGIGIIERTNDSVLRAQMVSRESESIGHEVISELTEQRESLVRTRDRLDGTNDDLKKTRVLLRSINRRLLTNKFYYRFIKK
ncbi:unnamed protein product [Oppiella nova]|uniref:t-SNARE coiled-coil homology domain-containing protein n=2 Tax=Oppiella nova TaxID=334625 RepID=A0A7R9LAC2_9ACAR|nr:unnamed protein product [Oppiella nova]CAG2161180.1 unnamed protein product [Oppiella nova]